MLQFVYSDGAGIKRTNTIPDDSKYCVSFKLPCINSMKLYEHRIYCKDIEDVFFTCGSLQYIKHIDSTIVFKVVVVSDFPKETRRSIQP